MFLPVRTAVVSCLSVILLFATGCAVSNVSDSSGTTASLPSISGNVHGGQQPVSGATIQLYAANTTATQGASTALLNQTATTDSNGNFNITGDYTCPVSNPLVYIVSTGGNPGLSGNVNNTGIALMALLGNCNSLTSSTHIVINELTTVVSVQTLAPFMTDYLHVGSAPSSVSGIGGAFATATDEIDFSTGTFISDSGDVFLPFNTLNTIADILAACVNSSGSGAPCSTLYSNTGGSSNTIAAALQMSQSPAQNTATLYGLISGTPPFQPYFTSVPTDFTTTVGYTVPQFIQSGTLDSNGHIWLYYGGYNYDPSTNTSTDSAGYIAVYDGSFNQLFTVNPGTGGLYYPQSLAPDAAGHVFAVNSNNTISEFASNGAAISPSGGWPDGLSSTFSPSGPGNNYIDNTYQGGPILIDTLGNIWGSPGFSISLGTPCYFELNSSGTIVTPSLSATTGTFCATEGISTVETFALDGPGNAWALGGSAIAKVNAQGTLAATATASQGCFYTFANLSTFNTQTEESVTNGLVYDHVNNQLWGYSKTGVGAVTDAGAPLFCDYGSTKLPVVVQDYASTSTTAGSPYSAGDLLIGGPKNGVQNGAKLDGAGNLWFVTSGYAATGVVGSTAGAFTGSATFASYLVGISPSGALLSSCVTGSQPKGCQPTGFGSNGSVSATNSAPITGVFEVNILGVDPSGNIWVSDAESNKILKITSLATANTVNY
jgi:hypothetical protein